MAMSSCHWYEHSIPLASVYHASKAARQRALLAPHLTASDLISADTACSKAIAHRHAQHRAHPSVTEANTPEF
jgi:hypothetical protein